MNRGLLRAIRQSSGAVVDPNLKLELKFNSQVYTDLAGTVAATTNDYVRAWQSNVNGVSALFTQSTDAARPQRVSDGLYFDGGDYVAIAHNSNFMDFGTGNFTIEGWLKFSSLSGVQALLSQQNVSSTYIGLRKNTDNTFQFFAQNTTNVANYTTTSPVSLSTATWYHWALVRNGSAVAFYVDGTSRTLTVTTAIGTMPVGTGDFRIGVEYDISEYFTGSMTDFRIYKGVAQYTSNFTPPTRNA